MWKHFLYLKNQRESDKHTFDKNEFIESEIQWSKFDNFSTFKKVALTQGAQKLTGDKNLLGSSFQL